MKKKLSHILSGQLKAACDFIGIDKAVYYSVLLRMVSIVGSIATVPMILTKLTPTEQGYYYTFGSILALQVFLELGFGGVAVQMMAHEAAHLKIDLTKGITGPQENIDRLSATFQFIRKWYAVISVLVGILLLPMGLFFFATSRAEPSVHWVGPWVILVVSTSGDLFVRSLDATVEGMGFVAESIRVNLWSSVVRILLVVLGLLFGMKLYAVPVASAVALIMNRWMVWKLLNVISMETRRHGKDIRINWRRDVLPFQWRIALSWVSGWFIFSAMVPTVFRNFGPVEAGRFGLALTLSSHINTLALNWTSTKAAVWGQMASRKDWKAMDALFRKVAPQAVGIAIVGSAIAVITVPYLGQWLPRLSGRIPDWQVLATLCTVTVLNQVVFAQAFYLRAHKKEPLLINSILGGAAMALGLCCFSYKSTLGMAIMYMNITLIVGLGIGSIIFLYCRNLWHSQSPGPLVDPIGK